MTALDHFWKQRKSLNDEDIARLSPLYHGYINIPGHYTFTLPELMMKRRLQSLNEVLKEENIAKVSIRSAEHQPLILSQTGETAMD